MEKIKKINKELRKLGDTKDIWISAEFEEIDSAIKKIEGNIYVFPDDRQHEVKHYLDRLFMYINEFGIEQKEYED